jgi:hypothetical protein
MSAVIRGGSLEAGMSRPGGPAPPIPGRGAAGHHHRPVEGNRLKSVVRRERQCRNLPAAALFIFIGAVPHSELVAGWRAQPGGFVLTGGSHARGPAAQADPAADPYLLETSARHFRRRGCPSQRCGGCLLGGGRGRHLRQPGPRVPEDGMSYQEFLRKIPLFADLPEPDLPGCAP